jgi:hypothetical protein
VGQGHRGRIGTKEEEVSTRLNELVSKYRRDTAGKADAAADRLKDELKRH